MKSIGKRCMYLTIRAASAEEDVTALAARLGAALQRFPPELQAARRRQLHFVTQPLPAMRPHNWLPAVLAQWRSPRKTLLVEAVPGESFLAVLSMEGAP